MCLSTTELYVGRTLNLYLLSVTFSAAFLVLKLGNEGLSDLVKPVSEPTCLLNYALLSKYWLNNLGTVSFFLYTFSSLLPFETLLSSPLQILKS